MNKKSSAGFSKFTKKKSNAAIKEQFRQEKRKLKKEREAFFDKKRNEKPGIVSRRSGVNQLKHETPNPKLQTPNSLMPLNKFIAHCGVCSRR